MTRLLVLKILLVIVGLALLAGLYPLVMSLFHRADISPPTR